MDVLIALATLLSAGAAVVAAYYAKKAVTYAQDTVRETRQLRREERLVRLPELVAELGETAVVIGRDSFQGEFHKIRRYRLAATLAATPEVLGACTFLAGTEAPANVPNAMTEYLSYVDAALVELTERIGEARKSDFNPALTGS